MSLLTESSDNFSCTVESSCLRLLEVNLLSVYVIYSRGTQWCVCASIDFPIYGWLMEPCGLGEVVFMTAIKEFTVSHNMQVKHP